MMDEGQQARFAQLNGLGEALQRKKWDELELEAKVDLLRQVIRAKEMAIGELREGLSTLMQHQHGKNGELLRPVYGGGMGQGSIGRGYDPLA